MPKGAERTVPILPCRDVGDIATFYEALGFTVTYRQQRPNPYLAVNRGGLDLHFFGMADFDPEQSYGSAIVLVSDTGKLYEAFAAGLRALYGKVPVAGIPRITRPRRKQGTAAGFTVVDPGGNWLRVSSYGPEAPVPDGRLDRVLANAARQGDAHGDEQTAIAVLRAGLTRHADAPGSDRVPLLLYLAELLGRVGDIDAALAVLDEIEALAPGSADEIREQLVKEDRNGPA